MPQNVPTFKLSDYDDRYFKWHVEHTRYAFPTMQWFNQTYKPESIVDFGCGIGYYLAASLGLHLKGYEINPLAKKYTNPSVQPFIEYVDCTAPISIEKYDCVICLETAEHIEPIKSIPLIENLTKACGKWIIFSAAPPNQHGTGHINCQPKSFWVSLFNNFGLSVAANMTMNVKEHWLKLGCPDYIYNNLMIIVP